MNQAGSSPDQPVYFKWVRDDQGAVNWGRVAIALGLTVLTAYLSVQTQRAASSPDFTRTVRMRVAQWKITRGLHLERAGLAMQDAGWAAYDAARQ